MLLLAVILLPLIALKLFVILLAPLWPIISSLLFAGVIYLLIRYCLPVVLFLLVFHSLGFI